MNAHRRLENLVAFGQTTAAMQDDGATPTLQAQFGDIQSLNGLQSLGQFGFSSSPPIGTNLAALFAGGSKSRGVIIGTVDPRSRRRLLVLGETVIFDVWGNEVHLSQSGVTIKHSNLVTIQSASEVQLTTPDVFTSGNLHAGTGATGVFTSAEGRIVTVRDGIIVNID